MNKKLETSDFYLTLSPELLLFSFIISKKIFYAKLKIKCCLLYHHYQIACDCKDRVRKRERASESGMKSALIASSSFD